MVIHRIQKLITFNTLIHPNAEHIIHPNAENVVGKKKSMLLLSLVVSRAYVRKLPTSVNFQTAGKPFMVALTVMSSALCAQARVVVKR